MPNTEALPYKRTHTTKSRVPQATTVFQMTLQNMALPAQDQLQPRETMPTQEVECKERTADSGCESDDGGRSGKPSMKEVAACFHLPIEVAAKQLGVGQTWLKLLCRSNGVARWPFRKIQSLQNSLDRSKKMQSLVEVAKVINQNLPKWLDLEGEAPRVAIPGGGDVKGEPEEHTVTEPKREASPVTRPEPVRAGCDLVARPKPLSLDTGVWRRPTPQNQSEAAPLTLPSASSAASTQPVVSAEEYAFRLRVLAQQQQALSAIAAELGQGPASGIGLGSSLPLLAGQTAAGEAAAAAVRQREWGSVLQQAIAKQHFAVAEKRGVELPPTSVPLNLDLNSLTSSNFADLYRQRAANDISASQALFGANSHPMPVLPLYGESAGLAGLRGFGGLGSQPYVVSPNFEQLFAASAAQQALSLEQLAKMRS